MFSVTKALKKLIECSKEDKEHCNNYITRAELNAILEAGQEDEVEELDKYETFRENVRMTLRSIEERLARLESVFLKEWKHNHLKEPSKPAECQVIPNSALEGMFGKPEKPVTEEKPTIDITDMYKSTCKEHGNIICDCTRPDDKPSECGHEHRFFKQEGTNYYQCHCGKTRPCRHEDLEDTIRISRKVAKEFIKWCEDYCLQETPKSMAIVIRKALEG